MRIQVRRGVFETNSSSVHSICIVKEKMSLNIDCGTITFKIGRFGWEAGKLTTPDEKASYLYTALCEIGCDYDDKEKYLSDKLNFIRDTLDTYGIRYHIVEPEYKIDVNGKRYIEGHIDSVYELLHFIEKICSDSQQLVAYLVSDRSFIITGNDMDMEEVELDVDYEHYKYRKSN